ncbi:hypothetical protein ACJJTC_009841 [Scirpophaga incertulas]
MVYIKSDKTQKNLYDRVRKLLVSDEWSDCCFTINGREFKAHKLILGISSPVFEAMFYGPLSSDILIEITDIEPEIFQLLLNYIYTDNVEISSIDQAFQLLYASRKYILEHLTNVCIDYILANISVDNVIDVLNYPEYLQEPQLTSYALKLFCEHAECDNNVVKFTNFMNTVEYASVVEIELSEPCFIKKNKWYKISFSWPENIFETYSYVVELRDMVYNGFKTKIEFEDSASNLSGSFLEGLKFCL